jgi:caffeoyl-CoA O-methyltransferase
MRPTIKSVLNELEADRDKGHFFNIPLETGKFLYNLILVSGSKDILEIGTSNGYSTIWLAEAAIQNKGTLTTIEVSEFKVKSAENTFRKAALKNVSLIHGDALQEINKLNKKFDFMFIDAIKKDYLKYLKLSENILKKGSIIVADNINSHSNKVKDYVYYVQNNPNYSSVLVPIGTGVEFSVKLR